MEKDGDAVAGRAGCPAHLEKSKGRQKIKTVPAPVTPRNLDFNIG